MHLLVLQLRLLACKITEFCLHFEQVEIKPAIRPQVTHSGSWAFFGPLTLLGFLA